MKKAWFQIRSRWVLQVCMVGMRRGVQTVVEGLEGGASGVWDLVLKIAAGVLWLLGLCWWMA